MLAINPAVPIYLHAEPIEMRKSFDGLFGIVKADLQRDVRNGGLFMFLNSRCNRIKLMYWDVVQDVLPSSNLGKAFQYLHNHWEALNVYVTDGRLPIDNNQVERLMKRIAIGRKNWLFIGSLRAGIRNASLMSLVASALRMELDVSMYLESVITHRLRGTAKLEELLPDRWRANHPEAVRENREQERRDKADVASVQSAKVRKTLGAWKPQ